MAPSPGRRRTRATAALRRPVDWTRGLGTGSYLRSAVWLGGGSGRAVGRVVERPGLGHLGLVLVLRTRVDLQLADHLPAQGALGEHALDGDADHFFGPIGQHVTVGA